MGKEGRKAHWKGGSRGEHPALVVMRLVGAGRWAGGAMGVDGVGTGLVHHTSSPSGCLAEVQGRGPAGVGAPHAKTN